MSDYYAKLLVESVFLIGVLCAITLFEYMFKNSTLGTIMKVIEVVFIVISSSTVGFLFIHLYLKLVLPLLF